MFRSRINLVFIIALHLACMAPGPVAPQSREYESISTAQGLSQGMVFDILQDKEGFMWVATKNGLNRYDGYSFKVFTNDPYNPHTLSSNTILKLFEDSKGRIWAGTENAGLNIYDKTSGKFYRIAHRNDDPRTLSGNEIRLMEELPDGRMLIPADGGGLNIVELTAGFFEKEAPPVITKLDLPGKEQVYGLGKDSAGQMWVGGMAGSVYRFDPVANTFIKLNKGQLLNSGYFTRDSSIIINDNFFLSNGNDVFPLFDVKQTPPGNLLFRPREKLWENLHRELYFYDVTKWSPGGSIQWTEQLPADTRLIYPFIIDRSGILWTGTVGYGLRKYNTASARFRVNLPGYSVRFIVPQSNNDVVLGNYAYGWRRLKNDSVVTNPFDKIPSVTRIDNFIISNSGDYWIKSDDQGYFSYNPSTNKLTPYPQINFFKGEGDKQPMLEDSKGNIWCPGLGGMITLVQPATGRIDSFNINIHSGKPMLPKAIVTALYEDHTGVFWIGTQEGFAKVSFNRSENALPHVQWYHNNSVTRNSLNYNHVSSFLDDPAQPAEYLWIGTKGGGLNRLNKTTNDFFHVTAKDGLPDDVVYGILDDDAGNIWGSTNKGIFCLAAAGMNDKNRVFHHFTRANGLQDDEFNTGAYAKLPNGNLAFGGVNGSNIFNPREILVAAFMPNVFITDILVNNQPVLPGDKTSVLHATIEQSKAITLTYLQDILTLEFSSLDFTAPVQNKYRYQLLGIDKDWVESGTRRTATYLHLPAGNYTFKVQGSNSLGNWSDQTAELSITVLPPWWRSWWMYGLYAILLGLCISAYLRFTVNRAKLKSQLSFEQLEAKRVKELDSVKTQLYTNITHEFRTPLTVILGMAQQVKSNPVLHMANGMDMIIRNGQSLLKLVNEMLDLSKLETGKMQLHLINGDLISFLRYIIESFHSLAESQQKQLHFLAEMDTLYMPYDPEKIRQIVANLLSNALKFTPEKGNIYISVAENLLSQDSNAGNLVIKVKDTGSGIPESQLQHIFDRFYQLDNSHTRKTEGTGIGLALTKELVKLMDGEITVKSPPTGANKGTEFTVILPLRKMPATQEDNAYMTAPNVSPQALPAPALDIPDEKPGEMPLILLVEDNADVVAYTASCLPEYRLAVGKDGREGFEIAAEMVPDLVITDVMMPFVDGFELCRQLRQDEHTSHIPIIMLTAKADIESKMAGLEEGADAYLEKPFNREELLLRIKKLLELRKNLQQHYLKNAGLGISVPGAVEVMATVPFPPEYEIEDDFVKKIRQAVESNLTDAGFTVEQLCKLVFMSHSQLHRKLDALTGCSPNKFIRIIRLNKAKELLKNPVNSIGSIALECGYNDAGYFARIFKQEHGVAPQEWRVSNKSV
jgi:signal transduction histidine kinase/CheY-like chemotaxis protein/ligand-binding sensor domain-containing protein/AraC-like DNA-binding protein